MLAQLNRSFEILRSRIRFMAERAQGDINEALNREGEIRRQLLVLRDTRLSGNRIRQHGDYHLSNVLYSGSDWLIANFEGDPYRSLSERRIKRSALRDVATMLRSFHYVAHAALFGDVPGIVPSRAAHPQLEMWAKTWYRWVSSIFLSEYLRASGGAIFLPRREEETNILLRAYMTERALIEIEYELEHRPEWIRIPVHGILEQL
jgi:maltose alpha-D-glucosyltransferase/alpha-amylase